MQRRIATEAAVRRHARRLFLKQGYADTSVRQIAAAARVSAGTVVSVGTKDQLFVTCMEEAATEAALGVLTAEQDPRAALRAFVVAAPGLTAEGTELSRDYLRALLAIGSDPGNEERLGRVLALITSRWAELLGLPDEHSRVVLCAGNFYMSLIGCVYAVAAGQLRADDAVELLHGMIDGATAENAVNAPSGCDQ
ncbi:TetR/AcrR family transcriptional regulator [Actinomyces ruminicola]|uniref:TetR/AcrR family transcriptional regulator n=1 Tax=Actinomyces ruminicola TaxID=332524 RepID=UPI0011CCC914|nr:TetR/AcrR family transcriptional regulator [Actinomyces ruminicola]